MTVCAAAICKDRILCISDRKLTMGNPSAEAQVEVEATRSKLFWFGGSTVMMYSDETSLAYEVANAIGRRVESAGEVGRVTPELIATHYIHARNAILCRNIEAKVLGKWGLTPQTFMDKFGKLRTPLVKQLLEDASAVQLPGLEVIIAGITAKGPDLWWACDDEMQNQRGAGYVAIGAGGKHVSSHLALANYSADETPRAEALFLLYSAKRKAERAPGVGETTDMFELGPEPTTFNPFFMIGPEILKAIYGEYEEPERKAFRAALARVERQIPTVPSQAAGATDAASSPTTSASVQT